MSALMVFIFLIKWKVCKLFCTSYRGKRRILELKILSLKSSVLL